MSAILIPKVNTTKIKAIPKQKIIAPISPNNFVNGTAPQAPMAPPPLLPRT